MSDDRGRRQAPQKRERNPKMIAIIVAIILFVWFVFANSRQVEVTFWVFNAQASLILVILLAAVLGAAITFLIMWSRSRDRQRDLDRQQRSA